MPTTIDTEMQRAGLVAVRPTLIPSGESGDENEPAPIRVARRNVRWILGNMLRRERRAARRQSEGREEVDFSSAGIEASDKPFVQGGAISGKKKVETVEDTYEVDEAGNRRLVKRVHTTQYVGESLPPPVVVVPSATGSSPVAKNSMVAKRTFPQPSDVGTRFSDRRRTSKRVSLKDCARSDDSGDDERMAVGSVSPPTRVRRVPKADKEAAKMLMDLQAGM